MTATPLLLYFLSSQNRYKIDTLTRPDSLLANWFFQDGLPSIRPLIVHLFSIVLVFLPSFFLYKTKKNSRGRQFGSLFTELMYTSLVSMITRHWTTAPSGTIEHHTTIQCRGCSRLKGHYSQSCLSVERAPKCRVRHLIPSLVLEIFSFFFSSPSVLFPPVSFLQKKRKEPTDRFI